MKLFIPEIKTQLKLTEDWSFLLHHEWRNDPLLEHFGYTKAYYTNGIPNPPETVTLPVGTILIVDRIYIRNGKSDFSSVTFRAAIPGEETKKSPFGKTGIRFWAKLSDVNNIEFDLFEEPKKSTRKSKVNSEHPICSQRVGCGCGACSQTYSGCRQEVGCNCGCMSRYGG